MRLLISTLLSLCGIAGIFAQNNLPDTKPEPIGGCEQISKLIIYPESARYSGIEGEVLVKLIVDSNGYVSKINVIKSLSKDCDSVVVETIKNIKFKPAKRNGHTVKTEVIVPIVFKLN